MRKSVLFIVALLFLLSLVGLGISANKATAESAPEADYPEPVLSIAFSANTEGHYNPCPG